MQALVRLLPDFPNLNAHYDEAEGVLRRHAAIHIGIATQTPNGLMVPVVRHAETRDLWDLTREMQRVTAAARDGSAAREGLSRAAVPHRLSHPSHVPRPERRHPPPPNQQSPASAHPPPKQADETAVWGWLFPPPPQADEPVFVIRPSHRGRL